MRGALAWLVRVSAQDASTRIRCRAVVQLALFLLVVASVGTAIGAYALEPWRTWVHVGVLVLLAAVVPVGRAGHATSAGLLLAGAGMAAGLVPVLVSGEVRTWPLFAPVITVTLLYPTPARMWPWITGLGLAVLGAMALAVHDLGAPVGTPNGELLVDCALMLLALVAVHAYGAATTRTAQEHELAARSRAAELSELAVRDPLTGLYNRRFEDAVLPPLLAETRRTGRPLAVALLDLDRFKEVNDTYGHGAGDAVLVEVGRILLTDARRMDLPIRHGGDEFMLLMPDTTAEQAWAVCERLRRQVEDCVFHPGRSARLQQTVSIGIATTRTAGVSTAAALVEAADTALLRAKQEERNRTVLY